MARSRDRGQIILLAGILLVLAFILYSLNLALLSNLGQQTGRETETALLEDYLFLRRGLKTHFSEELRNPVTGVIVCPSSETLPDFSDRVASQLLYLELLQASRGSKFRGTLVAVSLESLGPDDGRLHVTVRLALTSGPVLISDELEYLTDCKT